MLSVGQWTARVPDAHPSPPNDVIRLHDARHSCGTALHLRGVPMAVIAKWLGHADTATTARIYAHSQDDALRAASATLGQVVTPGQ